MYDCLSRVAIGTRERSMVILGCITPFGLFIMFIGMRIIHVFLLLIDFTTCVILVIIV